MNQNSLHRQDIVLMILNGWVTDSYKPVQVEPDLEKAGKTSFMDGSNLGVRYVNGLRHMP